MSDNDFSELEAEFGDVMAILAEGPQETPSERPSEDVWAAIVAGVGGKLGVEEAEADSSHVAELDSSIGEAANGQQSAPNPMSGPERENGSILGSVSDNAGVGFEQPTPANVVSLDSRRRWAKPAAVITAVAAAILLVAVPLGIALGGGPEQQAELAALDGFDGAGVAEFSEQELAMDVEGLNIPDDGSFYELWLLKFEGDELADLVSLGRIDGDGTFTVPDGVDIDEFSVVDVSIEEDDGDPSHSGASVLRGPLEQTT